MAACQGDQKKDAQLIGQFGVGFYSASSSPTASPWNRAAPAGGRKRRALGQRGAGDFEVETITRAAARHRRDPAPARRREDDYLDTWKLKSIIGKYSDHISLPILMRKEEWDEDQGGERC